MSTESRHPRSIGLDKMTALEVVRLMNEEERTVIRALNKAEDAIAKAAEWAATAFQSGGRVIYVGAGTSGRIAATDAAEMPPTFGVADDRFIAIVAGGADASTKSVESSEDIEHTAIQALNALDLSPKDLVIGIAASGRTPFVLAALRHAKQKGIQTCGIANNSGTPIFEIVDLGVFLDTGPEILTGSTRLMAGTAQKLALNRISTIAMVLSGKVIENLMVDVAPTNAKLKERCVRIVRDLSTVSDHEARRLLEQHDWNVRDVLAAVRKIQAPV